MTRFAPLFARSHRNKRSLTTALPTVLLLLFAVPNGAVGQNIRLTPYYAKSALYVDANRIFDYNRYEQARFALGLTLVTPSENWLDYTLSRSRADSANRSAPPNRRRAGQWTFHAYAAYGTRNREVMGGGTAQFRFIGRRRVTLSLEGLRDLERAGSRKLEDYRMLATAYNTGYVASRYSCVRGAIVKLTLSPHPDWRLTASLRQSWEDYRFDSVQRLFPAINSKEQTFMRRFSEGNFRADWRKEVSLCLRIGIATPGTSESTEPTPTDSPVPYLRALIQYDGDPGKFGLHLFAQVGHASLNAPYSRLFDLSGSGRAPYFFRNTFLTVPSNRFMASNFAYLFVNYTLPHPLYSAATPHNIIQSSPRPFVQLGAAWGATASGRATWEGMPVSAPSQGLFEPAAGIESLLRFGIVDLGIAAAYQFTPSSAPYHNQESYLNFALMAVANLGFDPATLAR